MHYTDHARAAEAHLLRQLLSDRHLSVYTAMQRVLLRVDKEMSSWTTAIALAHQLLVHGYAISPIIPLLRMHGCLTQERVADAGAFWELARATIDREVLSVSEIGRILTTRTYPMHPIAERPGVLVNTLVDGKPRTEHFASRQHARDMYRYADIAMPTEFWTWGIDSGPDQPWALYTWEASAAEDERRMAAIAVPTVV